MSSRMYGGGGGGGAHGRAMAWSGGGGSTKPPMVDNYLDSHGLNSGLGNAGSSKFPSVVESRPIQVCNCNRKCRCCEGLEARQGSSNFFFHVAHP